MIWPKAIIEFQVDCLKSWKRSCLGSYSEKIPEEDEETIKEWHSEIIGLFLQFWKERFGKCGVLNRFKYFSI